MERITYLIEQLQMAAQKNADAAQLLSITNQIQAELHAMAARQPAAVSTSRVAVVMPASRINLIPPAQPVVVETIENNVKLPEEPAEKVTEVLQVNEEDIEAELEEIRQKAEFAKKIEMQQHQNNPVVLFDEEPEIPTLIHQPNYKKPEKRVEVKEINEVVAPGTQLSLNEQLGGQTVEIGHKISETSQIKDLKKAIGINDRFVFINELFRGDEVMYERSIKTINSFSIYAEAQYWIERELKIKLGWLNDNAATQDFYSLVKRRFS